MASPEPIEYLVAADVARLVGLTPERVRQIVLKGELRVAARTKTGMRLFLQDDVDALIAAREAT